MERNLHRAEAQKLEKGAGPCRSARGVIRDRVMVRVKVTEPLLDPSPVSELLGAGDEAPLPQGHGEGEGRSMPKAYGKPASLPQSHRRQCPEGRVKVWVRSRVWGGKTISWRTRTWDSMRQWLARLQLGSLESFSVSDPGIELGLMLL